MNKGKAFRQPKQALPVSYVSISFYKCPQKRRCSAPLPFPTWPSNSMKWSRNRGFTSWVTNHSFCPLAFQPKEWMAMLWVSFSMFWWLLRLTFPLCQQPPKANSMDITNVTAQCWDIKRLHPERETEPTRPWKATVGAPSGALGSLSGLPLACWYNSVANFAHLHLWSPKNSTRLHGNHWDFQAAPSFSHVAYSWPTRGTSCTTSC